MCFIAYPFLLRKIGYLHFSSCYHHQIESMNCEPLLTHWGRVTHICINKLTIIGSDNGLSPGWRQVIIWTNAEILLNGCLGTNFSEILIKIFTLSFRKMHLKMLSGKWQPFFSVLKGYGHEILTKRLGSSPEETVTLTMFNTILILMNIY